MGVTSHWVSDKEVSDCGWCSAPFGLWRRKHHCRCCGGIFCSSCSEGKRVLESLGYESAVRVCDKCADAEDGIIQCEYNYSDFDEYCSGEVEEEEVGCSPASSQSHGASPVKYPCEDESDEPVTSSNVTSAPISFKTDSDCDSEQDRDEQKPSNYHSRKMKMTTNAAGVTIWAASASLTISQQRQHQGRSPLEKIAKSYQPVVGGGKRVTFSM